MQIMSIEEALKKGIITQNEYDEIQTFDYHYHDFGEGVQLELNENGEKVIVVYPVNFERKLRKEKNPS